MTIAQYLPPVAAEQVADSPLRSKVRILSKKDRQVLPTVPEAAATAEVSSTTTALRCGSESIGACEAFACRQNQRNERSHHEISNPLSQSAPNHLSGELQTKSCHSNPTGTQGRTDCAPCAGRSSDQYI